MQVRSPALLIAVAGALALGAWILAGNNTHDGEAAACAREVLFNSLQRETLPHLPKGAVVDVGDGRADAGRHTRCHVSYEIDLDDPRSARTRQRFESALRTAGIDPETLDALQVIPATFAPAATSATWWPHVDADLQERHQRLATTLGVDVGPLRVDAALSLRYRGRWWAFMRTAGTWRGVSH